jgi:hypothetical protein
MTQVHYTPTAKPQQMRGLVFVDSDLRGEASDGSQNPCIWQAKD